MYIYAFSTFHVSFNAIIDDAFLQVLDMQVCHATSLKLHYVHHVHYKTDSIKHLKFVIADFCSGHEQLDPGSKRCGWFNKQ